MIDILESHGKRLFWSRGVRQPCLSVLAELVGGGFIQDDGLAFSLSVEAVGNSLIISSQDDAETVLQFQVQLLIAGFDAWLAIEWRLDVLPVVGDFSARNLRVSAHVHSTAQHYTY